MYVAWGLHLAQEALRARAPLRQALAGPRLRETAEGRSILEALRGSGVPLVETTTRLLESIAAGCGDQGIVLLCVRDPPGGSAVLAQGAGLVLAAHGVQDPGNLGTMMRSALAFGVTGLVTLPGCADPFGSRAVRAAMGATFRLPVAAADERGLLSLAGAAGLPIIAADPETGGSPAQVDLARPHVLLLGGEGAGLPAGLLRQAQHRVRIPMAPGVESLNVQAACAVLLYEAARQRGFRYPEG